ncbi:MAG: DUF6709 family protein [Anaerocolumna jejuensis]
MVQNYLKKVIKKNNRGPFLISLIFVVIFLAVTIQESYKWSTLFTPLTAVNSIENIKDLHKQNKFYFQLKKADIYPMDFGIYNYHTVNGIKTSEEELTQIYGILQYDDGYLLVLLPKDYLDMSDDELASVTAVADIESLNDGDYHKEAYEEMVKVLSDAYKIEPSVVKENVAEICVTIPDHGRLNDQLLFIFYLLGLLISLAFFLYHLLVAFQYRQSRFYKRLDRIGSAEDMEYSINRAAEEGACLYISTLRPSNYAGIVTSDYIIGKKGMSLALGNTRNLVWVHLKLIKHKSHYITVGKTYQVLFYFKDLKAPIAINCPKEDVAANLIDTVSETLRVYCGYSKELEQLYKKNFDAFLKEVHSRKPVEDQL